MKRLDVLMVEAGLFTGRDRAKEAILAGRVTVDGKVITKPGALCADDAEVILKDAGSDLVSRGGNKLAHALDTFQIDVQGLTVLDVGAATGGFTDCMLRRGAVRSYAIDSGSGQLSDVLLRDERVINMEGQNIRGVTLSMFDKTPDFIAVDVSFISLSLVLPVLATLCSPSTRLVCLIKPQFEAGRQNVGKKGVVRDIKVHEQVIKDVISYAQLNGFCVKGLTHSPVRGPEGNIEFLIYLTRGDVVCDKDIKSIVKTAHEMLKGN